MSNDLWTHAYDTLNKALEKMDLKKNMEPEDLLKIAEIEALLAIGQELSDLNPKNTMYTGEDGVRRNGWGLATHE